MMKWIAAALATTVSIAGPALAQISDDFELDSSSSYTIVDSEAPSDGSVTFAYDYVAASIPLAPRSGVGTTRGLRITANDSAGTAEAITVFHNTQLVGWVECTLTIDVYLGVTGTTGTTEHAHIGVAGDGSTVNQLFSPVSGTGHFLAMTGDGGSSSDYRHFTPALGAVPSGDLSYLNSTNTTNATGDTYQALFPNPPYQFAGSPGNAWTTLEIEINAATVTYSLDGTPIVQATTEVSTGYVSLGHGDLFSSVSSPFQSQFVVYDNLDVSCVVPVELQRFTVD
jgi:hypothetical protein